MKHKHHILFLKIALFYITLSLFSTAQSHTPPIAPAGQITNFLGTWVNTNSNTRGIKKVIILNRGAQQKVHAYGACSPRACDWGERNAYAYGSNVSSNLRTSTRIMTATYKKGFSTTQLVMRRIGRFLHVESFTRFTDRSGRSNYYSHAKFKRLPIIRPLVAPRQLSPANHAVFNIYPRKTTLRWSKVPGAKRYGLEIDCFHCCESGKWCSAVGRKFKVVDNLVAQSYTFEYVGAQKGRWRVWSIDANGHKSPVSPWRYFQHKR